MTPPALDWVPLLVQSLDRALHEGLYAWDLEPSVDPLRWVLVLVFRKPVIPDEAPHIRAIISAWAEANTCHYKRGDYKDHMFRVLIYLEGLRPSSTVNPLDVPRARRH